MDEGIGFGEAMLKLPGFKILDVEHDPDEMCPEPLK